MTELDDLFRDGLGDRKADVPPNLWNQINARRAAAPDGEELDRLFAGKLAQRQAEVPAGMWARIATARRGVPVWRYAAVLFLCALLTTVGLFWAGTQVPAESPNSQAELTPSPLRANAPPEVPGPSSEDQRATAVLPAAQADPTPSRVALPGLAPQGSAASPAPAGQPPAGEVASTPAVRSGARAAAPLLPTAGLGTLAVTATDLVARAGMVTPTPGFTRQRGNRLQGEVLLGAAYAHQRFRLGAEADRELRNAREVSEFPQLSYQVTARVQYRLRSRLRLLAGLTYLDIRNQLEYEQAVNGQKQLFRGSNHLRLLEVPVLGSYVVSGKRLRLNLNAGPVFNLLTTVRGRYLHPDFAEPQPLGDAEGYRSHIGVGWTASLTTTYPVGKQGTTVLLLEPFFKTYPRSFTDAGAPLREHYWLAGLQVGLRKSL